MPNATTAITSHLSPTSEATMKKSQLEQKREDRSSEESEVIAQACPVVQSAFLWTCVT